jgi:hypothetical protein
MEPTTAQAPEPEPAPEPAPIRPSTSTYRRDPAYSASGVRRFIHEEIYPHVLAAIQACNAADPEKPALFISNCLLSGEMSTEVAEALAIPGVREEDSSKSMAAIMQGPLQEAIMACVKENPRPEDPIAYVGEQQPCRRCLCVGGCSRTAGWRFCVP